MNNCYYYKYFTYNNNACCLAKYKIILHTHTHTYKLWLHLLAAARLDAPLGAACNMRRKLRCEYSLIYIYMHTYIYIAEIAEPTQIHEFIHDVRASASGQRPSFARTHTYTRRELHTGRQIHVDNYEFIHRCAWWLYTYNVCMYVYVHAKCVKLSRSEC